MPLAAVKEGERDLGCCPRSNVAGLIVVAIAKAGGRIVGH